MIQVWFAQSQDDTDSLDSYIYKLVDVNPEFLDGYDQLLNELALHIKYPSGCEQIEGKVYVVYIIERDGSVVDIKIERSLHPKMDEAVVLALKETFKSKKHSPGLKDDVPVRVKMTLPIYFKLSN